MAATDKNYRNQNMLDIVFGVSCVLMLLSVIWMFAQDYFRDYKVEQRDFRNVEVAMAQRDLIRLLPDDERTEQINKAVETLGAALKERNDAEAKIEQQLKDKYPKKKRAEDRAQAVKADLDSKVSLLNIAIDEKNALDEKDSLYAGLQRRVQELEKEVVALRETYNQAQTEVEQVDNEIAKVRATGADAVKKAVEAEQRLKSLTEDFDRFAKLTATKQWTMGDTIRSMPVMDAFASPTKLQQITLTELPINYNFKYVTRYDRCTTCHQGIDRPGYDKASLRNLTEAATQDDNRRVENARKLLEKRRSDLPMLEHSFSVSSLPSTLETVKLTNAQINEYAAHPRLDLFVAENSPHKAIRFGCTICHEGQGSGTDFFNASHFPNDFPTMEAWTKNEHWHTNHYWDYPMLPRRFVESSCLKCHHEVASLLPDGEQYEYREGKKIPAPGAKVTAGYDLIRLNGCFGCHEITGMKAGRAVGPDLRLEPWPALDFLTPDAKLKAMSDPANPPGKQRKVGPSLKRISEKTNETWVRQWIDSPRGFRDSTRMPHFYHQANNNEEVLKGTDQEGFPDAEIHALTYYLFRKSEAYVAEVKRYDELNKKPKRSDAEEKELLALQASLAGPGTDKSKVDAFLIPLGNPELPAGYKEDKERGRRLFTEKGCLACHKNDATTKAEGNMAAVDSQAQFGPDLTRIALKLGDKPGDEKARNWLIQWIQNPNVYHPRTFMPVTHLQADEAADLAAWLLAQQPSWKGPDVPAPDVDKLKQLARVYLIKALPRYEVDGKLKSDPEGLVTSLIDKDDQGLIKNLDLAGKLKIYIGKKSVNQLGCFGCHDVSGFETAKTIGTPLNDWGKKDPERLAFEDILAYVHEHYYPTPTRLNEDGQGHPVENGKVPFERFFLEALEHHSREGFLYQKLQEPRSYDFARSRTWDERLRMPQFRFGRGAAKVLEGEEPETARLRTEAAAREEVMTFVLGLLAEPIPFSYLYDPGHDKMAIVKGKQVLDKFNCAGCHQLDAGIYEFNSRPDGEDSPLSRVLTKYEGYQKESAGEIKFANHNAFVGILDSPDRLRLHGLPFRPAEEEAFIKLTRAVKFNKPEDVKKSPAEREKLALNLGAGEALAIPMSDIVFQADPHGGSFVDLLAPYLQKSGKAMYNSPENARAGLPPPLLREGEKTQPAWLFQFLRDPQVLRPVAALRMPRFNMSEEEAMLLVNYFAAVDKLSNPGIGLDSPYLEVPQHDLQFWLDKSKEYNKQLGDKELEMQVDKFRPVWEKELQDKIADLKELIAGLEKAIPDIKDPQKLNNAKTDLANYKRDMEQLQSGEYMKNVRNNWLKEGSYASAAYRLLANKALCLNCHKINNDVPNLQPNPIGPNLVLTEQRLRPDYVERWVANPLRLLIYPGGANPMPIMLFANKTESQNLFHGTSREQAAAIRDILMDYGRISSMPVNRTYRPPAGGGSQ